MFIDLLLFHDVTILRCSKHVTCQDHPTLPVSLCINLASRACVPLSSDKEESALVESEKR